MIYISFAIGWGRKHPTLKKVFQELQLIKQKLQTMGQTNDEILVIVNEVKATQAKIRADIARLAGGINPNGLTAAEAANLKTELLAIASEAKAIDDLTPEEGEAGTQG